MMSSPSKQPVEQDRENLIQSLMALYAAKYLHTSPQTIESCFFDRDSSSFILRQSGKIYWGRLWGDKATSVPVMKLAQEYERNNEMFRQKVVPVIFLTSQALPQRDKLQKLMPPGTMMLIYYLNGNVIDLYCADADSARELPKKYSIPELPPTQRPRFSAVSNDKNYEAALNKEELSELLEIGLELAQLRPAK